MRTSPDTIRNRSPKPPPFHIQPCLFRNGFIDIDPGAVAWGLASKNRSQGYSRTATHVEDPQGIFSRLSIR